MLKFTKKEREVIISSDEIVIYENEIEIEKLQRSYEIFDEDIKKLKKFLKKYKLILYLEEDLFCHKELISKEKSEYTNIDSYIKMEILRKLSQEAEEYEKYYYFTEEKEYEIFIIEDSIIKNLIEVIIKEELSVDKIFISKEKKYEIKNYNQVISFREERYNIKAYVACGLIMAIASLGINYYKNDLSRELELIKGKTIKEEKSMNENKKKLEELIEENIVLSEESKGMNEINKKFESEIMWIIRLMPREIKIKNIYWEKNNLILEGGTKNLDKLFFYISLLEKEEEIESLTYDYIQNNQGIYTYVLELKVN